LDVRRLAIILSIPRAERFKGLAICVDERNTSSVVGGRSGSHDGSKETYHCGSQPEHLLSVGHENADVLVRS
jgi:hypothetical protein